MSAPRNKPSSKERKARPGGCFTVASQRARIARKKGGGGSGISPAGIVSEIMFQHGGLVAIMAVGQILGELGKVAVGALVGLVASFGRAAPETFQGGRPVRVAVPVALPSAIRGTGPRRGSPAPELTAGGGGAGGGRPGPSHPEPVPSPGYAKRGAAAAKARAESEARFGTPDAYEWVAQKLQYDLDAPIGRHVKGLQRRIEKVAPEVVRLLSRETNDPNSVSFRAAKSMFKSWSKANPGYTDICAAHAIFGDLIELQRAVEEAARLMDPTKGPANSGPENGGDEGEGGTRLKAPNEELPAPSPFKI